MVFKHKGYTLQQSEIVNHHYMIFDSEGNFVCHAAYNGELFTQKQAEEAIDNFIKIREAMPRIIEEGEDV